MRSILLIVLIVLTVGGMFGGCSSKQEAELRALEQWMDTNTDSVISVLEAMDKSALSSPRLQALHTLTLTRARDKKHILSSVQRDDSLIKAAADYFGRKGPEFDYMRSLYYTGRVNFCIGRYDEAMRYAMRAEKVAERLGDDYWLAKIAELQGFVFGENYNYPEELKARRIAAEKFHKSGYEINSLYASMDVGYLYYNICEYNAAISLTDSLLPHIIECKHNNLHGAVYHLQFVCKVKQQKYDEAKSLVDSIEKYADSPNVYNTPFYVCLAEISDNAADSIGFLYNIEKAWRVSETQGDSVFTFDALMRFYENRGDYKNALAFEDSILKLNNRQIDGALEQSGIKVQREILRAEVKEREWEAHKREIMLWVAGVVSVILTILLMVGWFLYREYAGRKAMELDMTVERLKTFRDSYIAESTRTEELTEQVATLRSSLIESNNERERRQHLLEVEIAELYKEQWRPINKICTAYLNKEGSGVDASIRKDVDEVIKELRSAETQRRLEMRTNAVKRGLVQRFREQCGSIITNETMPMVIYLFAELAPNAVCLILGIKKITTFYSRRKTLINKIQALAPEDAEEFISELKG